MVVLDPLKLVISNFPEGKTEMMLAENGPDPALGTREIPFSKELWIEKDDFMELPAKKWFRLAPGTMVRLKNAYIIRCDNFIKNDAGEIIELHCSYLPETRSGADESGISVKGTIHWVSAAHAKTAEVRLYDRLFKTENPSAEDDDFRTHINPDSLQIIKSAFIEPSLEAAKIEDRYQFLRKGYFCADKDSTPEKLIFNRTVTLKDTWAKATGK